MSEAGVLGRQDNQKAWAHLVFVNTKGNRLEFSCLILDPDERETMTHTYCMTSHCALAKGCARYEDDAGKHLLKRTYADFSEELIHQQSRPTTCPFF
ncbi:MAG: hypothetical protein Q7T90_04825, partial [Thiobacillus sp.]|nr:hypothetical protein [Thiobacillus sp.]